MTADKKNYDDGSDAKHRHDAPWTRRLNETEFLANQRADAQRALNDALDDLKVSLGEAADVRLWTKEHPWASLGVAAATGFALAAALIPRRDESLGERHSSAAGKVRRKRRPRSAAQIGLLGGLLDKLFDLAKVAIGNLIMMQIQSRMAPYTESPASEAAENGAPANPEGVAAGD